MSILVNTHSEVEEQLLIEFLNSHKFEFKSETIGGGKGDIEAFLDAYNKELDEAENEIDSGNYMTHDEVEKLFSERRKSLNGNRVE